jgi:hypothetical protein
MGGALSKWNPLFNNNNNNNNNYNNNGALSKWNAGRADRFRRDSNLLWGFCFRLRTAAGLEPWTFPEASGFADHWTMWFPVFLLLLLFVLPFVQQQQQLQQRQSQLY